MFNLLVRLNERFDNLSDRKKLLVVLIIFLLGLSIEKI